MDLFEIPPETPRYRKEYEVIPDRPFVFPGRGRIAIHHTGLGTAEVMVFDKDNNLTDRVPATIVPPGPDPAEMN